MSVTSVMTKSPGDRLLTVKMNTRFPFEPCYDGGRQEVRDVTNASPGTVVPSIVNVAVSTVI